MNTILDIEKLKQIKTDTFTKLDDLKDGWSDDDQRDFYDTKVTELEIFMEKSINDFQLIDESIKDLENKLNHYINNHPG